MSSTDRYSELVPKSIIDKNLGDKTYDEINNILIPDNEIINFYKDSLFYLHFYNSLYLALYIADKNNLNNVDILSQTIKNLKITFNTAVTSTQNNNTRMGVLAQNITNGTVTNPLFTFYTGLLDNYYHNIDAYEGYTYSATGLIKDFIIPINLPNDPSLIGKTSAIAKITVNLGNQNITNIDNSANTITVTSAGNGYYPSESTKVFYNSDFNPPLVNLSKNGLIFKGYFSNEIADLKFTSSGGAITKILPLTSIRGSQTFTTFQINYDTIIGTLKPKIENIVLLPNATNPINAYSDIVDTSIGVSNGANTPTFNFDVNSINAYNESENIVTTNNYTNPAVRKKRFRMVMKEILNTSPQKIFGYLLYQKIYYNRIVCNTSIQLYLRQIYLNNTNMVSPLANETLQYTGSIIETAINSLKVHIDNLTNNLRNLKVTINNSSADYTNDKDYYISRIQLLNNTSDNFNQTLESLNNVASNYNQYINYYQKLKKYVSVILVFLILFIIATIVITIVPTIDYNAKNTYYILMLVILIIFTIIYYNNFKHVGLYEKFVSANYASGTETCNTPSCIRISSFTITNLGPASGNTAKNGKVNPSSGTDTLTVQQNNQNTNHATFWNKLTSDISLTDYRTFSTKINEDLGTVLYVANNKVYTKDGNDYLYKLYIEKTKKIDVDKLKKVKLSNIIEALKKQISFIFNVILIISLLTILLLICLIFYNSAIMNIEYIIVIAVIFIILIMFYFNYAVVQPTRMKANKNYWSNVSPTEATFSKF